MAEKRNRAPLKRKVISIETKIQILNRLDNGQTATDIARSLDLNEATVRTIKRNETEIRRAGSLGLSISTKFTSRTRAPILEKMERALSIWIDDSYEKKIPLSQRIIQEKALRIYGLLERNGEPSSSIDFVASNGWFDKFKKRFSIHSLKFKGEAASADDGAATTYPEEIQGFIKEEEFLPDQVFNADETGLCWKKMPSRTFLSKNEKVAPGFKAQKDRFTLLLCSNASGDFQVKPMLVYKSFNPRAFKGIDKSKLPVYWKANSKAWVTAELFKDWFLNCFVPEVEKY